MTELRKLTLGDIVTKDIRTASIFKNAGIDFCCGGNKNFEQACQEKGIDPSGIETLINSVTNEPVNNSQNFSEWDVSFLCDYIVNTHHKYVTKALPELDFYINKITSVHGENHPELNEVLFLFGKLQNELREHMKKEEEVLFPSIKEAISHDSGDAKSKISTEISRMKGEHEFAGEAMDRINELTGKYNLPADGCNSFRLTYQMLEKFEDDLHIHVHLENNILYPKALEL